MKLYFVGQFIVNTLLWNEISLATVERPLSCICRTTTCHTWGRVIWEALTNDLCTVGYKEMKKMHQENYRIREKLKKTQKQTKNSMCMLFSAKKVHRISSFGPCDVNTLSSLRQFLAIESPLKMMRNAFYFTLKAVFILEIFQFLFWIFDQVGKWLDKKLR